MTDKDEICNMDDPSDRELYKNNSSSEIGQDNNSTKEVFESISKEFKRRDSRNSSKDKKEKKINISNNGLYNIRVNTENYDSETDILKSNDIIKLLRNKLIQYETEMKTVLEEKVSLQLELNELKIKMLQVSKKNFKEITSNTMLQSVDSVKSNFSENEISKNFVQESSGLKYEIENLKNIIESQKACLLLDNSLLNESIEEISKKTDFCSINANNNINNANKIEEVIKEISKIKADLYSLFELVQLSYPNQISTKINSDVNNQSKDKMNEIQDSINEMKALENNLRAHFTNNKIDAKSTKSAKSEEDKEEKEDNKIEEDPNYFPSIDSYFKLNGKTILVDEEKNLWQLEKCEEFEKFCKINRLKNSDKQQLFNLFIGVQEEENDKENEENIKNELLEESMIKELRDEEKQNDEEENKIRQADKDNQSKLNIKHTNSQEEVFELSDSDR